MPRHNVQLNPSHPRAMSRTRFSGFGLFLVHAMVMGVSAHFALSGTVLTAYRDVAAALFTVLCIANCHLLIRLPAELVLMLSFAGLVTISLAVPTALRLYDNVGDLTPFQVEWPRLSQFRSATLYLPLVAYLAMRGVSREELRSLAVTMTLAVPTSIVVYLYAEDSVGIDNLTTLGGGEFRYLDFIPMVVFFGLASAYLVISGGSASSTLLATISIVIVLLMSGLTSGRQNVAFTALAGTVLFATARRNDRFRIGLYALLLMIAVSVLSTLYVIRYGASEKLATRYGSIGGFADLTNSVVPDDGSRYSLLIDGVNKLQMSHLALGAGAEACEGPGPHCDYVRQVQRRGVLAPFLAYSPFVLAIRHTIKGQWRRPSSEQRWLLLMLAFPLYYAVFGFPLEDACKANVSFLGLGLALGYLRNSRVQAGGGGLRTTDTLGRTRSRPGECGPNEGP